MLMEGSYEDISFIFIENFYFILLALNMVIYEIHKELGYDCIS